MLLLHVPDDVLLLLVLSLLVQLGGLENLGGELGDGVPGNLCRLNIFLVVQSRNLLRHCWKGNKEPFIRDKGCIIKFSR